MAESGANERIKPGDYVAVVHECTTEFGTVRHDTPILVTSVRSDAVIPHARGVRCDGSLIEWSFAENDEKPAHPEG